MARQAKLGGVAAHPSPAPATLWPRALPSPRGLRFPLCRERCATKLGAAIMGSIIHRHNRLNGLAFSIIEFAFIALLIGEGEEHGGSWSQCRFLERWRSMNRRINMPLPMNIRGSLAQVTGFAACLALLRSFPLRLKIPMHARSGRRLPMNGTQSGIGLPLSLLPSAHAAAFLGLMPLFPGVAVLLTSAAATFIEAESFGFRHLNLIRVSRFDFRFFTSCK